MTHTPNKFDLLAALQGLPLTAEQIAMLIRPLTPQQAQTLADDIVYYARPDARRHRVAAVLGGLALLLTGL